MSKNLKEIADKIMKNDTKVIGIVFETHARYIETKEGKQGLKKVEKKMAELGYPINFDKLIKGKARFKYYPIGLADLVIIVAKEIFGWSEKDVFDMGNNAPKYSFIVKLLLRYFVTLERSLKEAPKYWRKHFTKGKLEYELHNKEKYVIIKLKFDITHPLLCIFYAGYFLRIAQYVVKSKNITIKETKCKFKGDEYHEYFISWK